jgi:hypothetical protein
VAVVAVAGVRLLGRLAVALLDREARALEPDARGVGVDVVDQVCRFFA